MELPDEPFEFNHRKPLRQCFFFAPHVATGLGVPRGGEFTDHTWSVGDRWTITSQGYTLAAERVDDSSDYKEWVIHVTRP